MTITFDHVSKQFPGGVLAVDDVSLTVAAGETLVLLGTSGSGKTTSMKMINRLIEPTGGTIAINDTDIMSMNPVTLRRQIGYAIQGIGLFPHMTIGENIGTVPALLKWDKQKTAERCNELLTMVGLEPDDFRDRYPVQLSGGQQQRVGVARCLAADPPIILMDEPFGALDPITREQLQDEFISLESYLKKTVVFVTHDVFEAVKLADRIAVMHDGRLQQLSTPKELVENPANEFVDSFLGAHKFQLALSTQPITELVRAEDGASGPPEDIKAAAKLTARMSLFEALDVFKQERRAKLPVYRTDKTYLGMLDKQTLRDTIATIIDETA